MKISESSFPNYFWRKVEKTETCWLWKYGKNKAGYGKINYLGKQMGAHQVAWILTFGEIPKYKFVCHKNDCNKACVNPEHLYLASNSANQHEAITSGKLPTGEKAHAAKLTDKDIIEIRSLCDSGLKHKEIANRFNITKEYVSMLNNNYRVNR